MVRRFLYLNGLAIISVVLFHTAGMGFVAMFAWGHRYLPPGISPFTQIGSITYYLLRLVEQLVPFSIPAFLLISGYFISSTAGKNKSTLDWTVVFARIRKLIIPYLIWTAIVILLRIAEGKSYSFTTLIRYILTGQTSEVYYFVPLLVQLYLLAPLLIWWGRRNWKSLLVITGVLQLLQQLTAYPTFLGNQDPFLLSLPEYIPKWFFIARIFWFSLGVVIGLKPLVIKPFLIRYRTLLIILTLVLIPAGMIEWELFYRWSGQEWLPTRETLIDSIYSISLVFAFMAFDKVKTPASHEINYLGANSYGIYLIHALFIEYAARAIYRFFPAVLGQQWLFQPILIGVGLGIPVALMLFVDRSIFRRYYSILFG